ncbi:UDP-N-acetylmuramate--L-alanine ligase [Desulfosarcina sp. OttesenSCG-928-B08]|nr:UDP-N-acetylmuramate--L-alanine ligase [Desulfosarcina sp. OttesenSCG-928-B08]
MYLKQYHIHFVGIGGIGMSGIAGLLLALGYRVSGSDARASDTTDALVRDGAAVYIGHRAGQADGANVVVVSSAIDQANPEVAAARNAGIPVISRAAMLADLMGKKYGVAISGAHGKTTTTSLTAAVLVAGGLDPTVVIGGKLKKDGRNAVLGKGDFMVAEADESDGSFLRLSPAISVVTNIDREHLDFYPNLAAVQQAFLQFVNQKPFYGLSVLCLDSLPVRELLPDICGRITTYGLDPQADLQAKNIRPGLMESFFSVVYKGDDLGEFYLPLSGRHNVVNSLAAIAVGLELEIPLDVIKSALARATGVQRRMDIRGEVRGICVVDDYGHHPTEIRATLQAIRDNWPERRVVVVFQPHRYSRTKALMEEFGRCFENSDHLVILPIYGADETPETDVTSQHVAAVIAANGHPDVRAPETLDACVVHLEKTLGTGDLLLTLGAGDVYRLGDMMLERMRA